jgi:hypothetical protein
MQNQKTKRSRLGDFVAVVLLLVVIGVVVLAVQATKLTSAPPSTTCLLQAGFECETLILSQNGTLTLNLLQTTQDPINITGIECNVNDTVSSSLMFITNSTYPKSGIEMPVDGNRTFVGIPCYTAGVRFTAQYGSSYQGYLIINYTGQVTGFSHLVYGRILVKAS